MTTISSPRGSRRKPGTRWPNDPDLPLFNLAISGQYPPGSTYKIIVASAGLRRASSAPARGWGRLRWRNDGIIWLPNEYFPWDRTRPAVYSWIHKYGYGHGSVTRPDAIAVSDDIFFYKLGGGYLDIFHGLGVEDDRLLRRAVRPGQRPASSCRARARAGPRTKWKRLNYAQNWLTGDTYNMSIGQGYVLVTPLQIANVTAAVANRGLSLPAQLVNQITDDDGKVVRPFQPC